MRTLHPTTILTVALRATDDDFACSTVSRRQILSHAFSECHKYLATRQKHPKMWLTDKELGVYMLFLYKLGSEIGCKFDIEKIKKYPFVYDSFSDNYYRTISYIGDKIMSFGGFTDDYLFSDCISLYFKGANIMPYIYGEDWCRLVPIENLEEVFRVVSKTLLVKSSKRKVG